ncbi:MAG: rhomboid family intramembrane serine protease [Gemmataceae bacterium]
MGIYDRDYYRKEGPSYLDRLVPSGAVCKWLIIVNVVVYFAQLIGQSQGSYFIVDWFSLRVADVMEGQVWRLLTYAFLHGSFSHVFWNMLFLWWFGSDLEEIYGWREFLCFYLLSAIVGGLGYMVHVAIQPDFFWAPNVRQFIPAIGASGAVTALLLLCAFHFPTRQILVMLMIPVPIWLFVIFQVLQDVAGLFEPANPVAVSIHLGGAAFAAAYYKLGWRVTSLWDDVRRWLKRRRQPKLRIYRPDEAKQPVAVGAPDSGALDEHLEAKVDAVLEKVARTGQESLTEQERLILIRASEIYKKKRT